MGSAGPRMGVSCLRVFAILVVLAPAVVASAADGGSAEYSDDGASAVPRGLRVRAAAYELWIAPGVYDVSISQESLRAKLGLGMGTEIVLTLAGFLDVGVQVFGLRRDGREGEVGSTLLWHFGGQVGLSWWIHDRVMIGLAVLQGFHVLSFADADEVSIGAGLGAVARAGISPVEGFWFQLQVGLLAQPVGGHEVTDVTLPPTWFGGLGFALAFSR